MRPVRYLQCPVSQLQPPFREIVPPESSFLISSFEGILPEATTFDLRLEDRITAVGAAPNA